MDVANKSIQLLFTHQTIKTVNIKKSQLRSLTEAQSSAQEEADPSAWALVLGNAELIGGGADLAEEAWRRVIG